MNYLYEEVQDFPRSPGGKDSEAQRSTNSSTPSQDRVVVDGRYYEFCRKFRKDDLDNIRKGCNLEVRADQSTSSDQTEIRFVKARTGTCEEWRQRFVEMYERLESDVAIERIELADLENVKKMMNTIKSYPRVMVAEAGHDAVDIVCERGALDRIRCVIAKHRLKKDKRQLTIPAGFDVNGAFRLYIYVADITKLAVDVIVNITNESLRHDAGVSKAIAKAAGPEFITAAKEYLSKAKVKTGNVFSTMAGNLPSKVVYNALKPKLPEKDDDSSRTAYRKELTVTFENALTAAAADKQRYTSVAVSAFALDAAETTPAVVIKALKDAILKVASLQPRSPLKQVNVVHLEEDVVMLMAKEFHNGGRLKAPNGKNVNVKRLAEDDVKGVIANNDITDCQYSVVEKPTVPKRRPELQRKCSSRHSDDMPPVPEKNSALIEELKQMEIYPTAREAKPPVSTKPVWPKETKDKNEETPDKGSDKTKKQTRSVPSAEGAALPLDTSVGDEQHATKIANVQPIYQLAGPLPELYENVDLEAMKRQQYDGAKSQADKEDETDAHIYDDVIKVDFAKAKLINDADGEESLAVVVDRRYYTYMSKFRKKDFESIQKEYRLSGKTVHECTVNVVEIRFSHAGKNDWQSKYVEKYEELKMELGIEEVALAELENVNKMMRKIKSQNQAMAFKRDDVVDIVCRREALERIKAIIRKHTVKKGKQCLEIPIGYDMNGAFRLYLYVADITKLAVDAIVHTTKEFIQNDSGASKTTDIKTSSVQVTRAGDLPCRALLNAIVPKWTTCSKEADMNAYSISLMKSFENLFITVDKERYKTIGITFESGVFSGAVDVAVKAMTDVLLLRSAKYKKSKLKEVHVVDKTKPVIEVLMSELGAESVRRTSEGQVVNIGLLPESETQKTINTRFKCPAPAKGIKCKSRKPNT